MKNATKNAAWVLTVLVMLALVATQSSAQKRGRAASRGAATNRADSQLSASETLSGGSLPYRVEIGDGLTPSGTATVVTLAVGAFTVVRCPQPGLNLVFGDPSAIEYQESAEGQNQYQLYLKPKRAGVYMNVGIEMPSGLATFYVRSVAVKGGARVGDFNGEVVIRPAGYRDELARARERASEMEKKAVDAEARIVAAETSAAERVGAARFDTIREALTTVESVAQGMKPKRAFVTAERKRVRIVQIGGTTRTTKSMWAVFLLENRDSRVLTLESVRAGEGVRVLVAGREAHQQIAGRGTARIALCLELDKEKSPPPHELTFVINGANVAVPLAP